MAMREKKDDLLYFFLFISVQCERETSASNRFEFARTEPKPVWCDECVKKSIDTYSRVFDVLSMR